MKYALDIYLAIDGTDNWPLIDTILSDCPADCIEQAERKYPDADDKHWTNPYCVSGIIDYPF